MVMPCNRTPFLHWASSSTRLRRKVRLFQRNFYRTNTKIYNLQAKQSFHYQTTNLIQTLKHLPSVRLPKRTVSYLTEATYKSDCCLHDARKRKRGTGRNRKKRKKHKLAISPEPLTVHSLLMLTTLHLESGSIETRGFSTFSSFRSAF